MRAADTAALPLPDRAARMPARHAAAAWPWALVAVAALGIAGTFALLLAISRVPGIETVLPWPIGFFQKGLVVHVVFSFVVWFLGLLALMLTLASADVSDAPPSPTVDTVAGFGAALAMPMLFVPAFLDRGEATLNNYVPTIIDPLYYAGLTLMALAVGAVAAMRLPRLIRAARMARPGAAALTAGAGAYLAALISFTIAAALLRGQAPSHAFNEDLFWGGGHGLQAVNALALIGAWMLLARAKLPHGAAPLGTERAMATILAMVALIGPALYLVYAPFGAEQTQAFTTLQYTLGTPALIVALVLLARWPRPFVWSDPATAGFALSVLLFTVGGALGLFVDGADTRTPAHYHGVIAGVTLAFMTLFYQVVVPALGREPPSDRWQRRQLHLFGWGQLVACVGLFMAGGYGAPRKVAGTAQGLSDLGAMIGMGMNGFGGLVAVIGGAIFVIIVGRALIRPAKADAPHAPGPRSA